MAVEWVFNGVQWATYEEEKVRLTTFSSWEKLLLKTCHMTQSEGGIKHCKEVIFWVLGKNRLSLSVCHHVVFLRISVLFPNFGFKSFLIHLVEVLQTPSDDLISDFFLRNSHFINGWNRQCFLPDRFFSKLKPNPANFQSQTAGRKQRWRILHARRPDKFS